MRAIRRAAWTAGAVLALSGLVGAAAGCAGGSGSNGSDNGGATLGALQKAAAPRALLGSAGAVAGAAHSPASDVSLKTTLPAIRSAVIKTATLGLRIQHGRFGSVMDAAGNIARRYGGFVSRQSSSGTSVHEGRLVMRVPAGRFTPALVAVERLGRPTNESVVGVDVTQQFVDLGARLDNLRSQEQALRHLMERTQSVSDTIRVQGVLQGVELQMEEIQGRLIYLRNRTALSTISIDVQEAGARPAPPVHASAIWKAGERALHSATAVVTGVIVGAGFVIPIAILALLAVLIGRLAVPWAAPLAARRRGPARPPSDP